MVVAVGRLDQLRRSDARRRVEERYSELAIADGYLKVYEQMLKGSARPRPVHR
jgi:glycosyltransferase involved in cell wall biosynthesis